MAHAGGIVSVTGAVQPSQTYTVTQLGQEITVTATGAPGDQILLRVRSGWALFSTEPLAGATCTVFGDDVLRSIPIVEPGAGLLVHASVQVEADGHVLVVDRPEAQGVDAGDDAAPLEQPLGARRQVADVVPGGAERPGFLRREPAEHVGHVEPVPELVARGVGPGAVQHPAGVEHPLPAGITA